MLSPISSPFLRSSPPRLPPSAALPLPFTSIPRTWQRTSLLELHLPTPGKILHFLYNTVTCVMFFSLQLIFVTTAKGAAETLKFNMALILLPVCRNTVTWIRSKTKLGVVVPFNDNINFHKDHRMATLVKDRFASTERLKRCLRSVQ